MSWLASSELSVDRGSRGGVVFVHGTGICSDLGEIDLRSGASGHGPKCRVPLSRLSRLPFLARRSDTQRRLVDLQPMLGQSISGLLKKINLGWNINSEGLGLELVDLRLPASRGGRFCSFALFI